MKKNILSLTEKKYFKYIFFIFIFLWSGAIFYAPLFGLGLTIWFLSCSIFGLYFWPKKMGPMSVLRGWRAYACSFVSLACSIYILINDFLLHNYIDNPFTKENIIVFVLWYFFLLPYFLYLLYNAEKFFLYLENN